MHEMDNKQIRKMIIDRNTDERLDMRQMVVRNADLSWLDMSNTDWDGATFDTCDLTGAVFDNCNLHKTWFKDCKMREVRLTYSDVTESNMRYMDLTGADFSGSNFHCTLFEYAILEDITDDENTRYYRMVCPEEGPFVAWKCCTDLRVVQLLVPADAKRVSATDDTCRCSKAKVLSIKNIDETVKYDWAQSTVDQDFYYEVGKWVEPANTFCEDRWMDSSPGIHFFMERQQCIDYQAK